MQIKNAKLLFVLSALVLVSCNSSPSKKKKTSSMSGEGPTTSIEPTSGSVMPDPTSGSQTSGQSSSPTSIPHGPVGPDVVGDTDYSRCQEAFAEGDPDELYTQIYNAIKDGTSGSYGGLYDTYKAAYLREDGYLFDYYSSITSYDVDKDTGSYKKEGDAYNREHSIPQSWWGGGTGTGTQGADPFIVVPSDGYVNGARSNHPFGYVKTASKEFSNSKVGTADSSYGYSGTVFEPHDSLKGDFARIYFYAVAKYNAYSWTQGSGSDYGRTCFTGNKSQNYGLTDYSIKLFSEWSNNDPVSEWELHVNNNVEPIQGNRNPFIDHPEYANLLWGSNASYTMYNH